jgi:hypothetical protein
MIRNYVLSVIGSLLMVACANNQVPTSNLNSPVGFLKGTVTIGPMCPVESIDNPCTAPPSLYTSHKLVIIASNGEKVQEVAIAGDGSYRTELAPGTYAVDYTPRDIGIRRAFRPPTTEIRAGETTILNIKIDTGIR